MIMWVGGGEVHLKYIPRKPTPLGIMLKTLVDGSTGILLACEIVEAKEDMVHLKLVAVTITDDNVVCFLALFTVLLH